MECRSIGFPMVKIVTSSGSDQAFRIERRVCHISQFLSWKGGKLREGRVSWVCESRTEPRTRATPYFTFTACSSSWNCLNQQYFDWYFSKSNHMVSRGELITWIPPWKLKSVPHWNKGMKRTRYVLVDEGSSNTGNQNDVCMCRWQHATCALTGETIPLHKLQLSRVKSIDRDWLTKCMIDHIDHVRSNGFEHFRRLYSKPFFRTTNPHSSYQFAGVKGVKRGRRKNALPRATQSAYHLIGSVWCRAPIVGNTQFSVNHFWTRERQFSVNIVYESLTSLNCWSGNGIRIPYILILCKQHICIVLNYIWHGIHKWKTFNQQWSEC